MDDQRDSQITAAPTLPRPEQRDAVDAFCRANRAWALRQARRNYRHLPEPLREQAVDRALADLRRHAPASTERRALSADLAERLTEALRHVHVDWCLDEAGAVLRREGTEAVQPEVHRDELARFVESGLGGLERAVLQLEIGAGRDSRTTRAALRLHPRVYAQHRSAGLSKLRDAISAAVIGRACDQHVAGVVDAAMGDRHSMDALATGSRRCRFCAREAQGLRSVLHERLAVAPWPLVIKPAGLLAAKLGAAGAILGGKAAGVGTGAGVGAVAAGSGAGSGAPIAATVLAAAALATGTAAVVGSDHTPSERGAQHAATATEPTRVAAPKARTAATVVRTERETGDARRAAKARRRVSRRHRNGSSGGHGGGAPPASSPSSPSSSAPSSGTTTVAAASRPSAAARRPAAPKPSKGPVSSATKPVTQTVAGTAHQVTSAVPPVVPAPVKGVVDNTVGTVTSTVDQAANAVDGLLEP